jgi:hypothetical protein
MILGVCLFLGKWFSGNYFPNFHVFVCYYKSWSTKNTFLSKKNLTWIAGKYFPFILEGKHFSEVVKILKISYYLLIMSNLILKLLIVIYFVWIFFFSNSSLKIWFNLIFILTLVLIFMIVIYFSLIIF